LLRWLSIASRCPETLAVTGADGVGLLAHPTSIRVHRRNFFIPLGGWSNIRYNDWMTKKLDLEKVYNLCVANKENGKISPYITSDKLAKEGLIIEPKMAAGWLMGVLVMSALASKEDPEAEDVQKFIDEALNTLVKKLQDGDHMDMEAFSLQD
jgi:hypothetical protein